MSAHPTTPQSSDLCPHFGECGGCKTQDVTYQDQLTRKQDAMKEWFAESWKNDINVTESPLLWNYRNKVEFSFGRMQYPEPPPKDFQRESVLGFKKGGRWYHTLNITDCRIGPTGAGDLLIAVREWMHGNDIRSWHDRSNDGILRWLMLREAKGTGERMVVLVTKSGELDTDGFVEVVQRAWPATTIVRGIVDASTDCSFTEDLEVLHGDGTITETLTMPGCPKTLSFRISPMSFFQTNTLAAERLYSRIREWIAESAPKTVYDLYGGAGGIAFTVADLVDDIVSVESVTSATSDGNFNAEQNKITNVSFETSDVRAWLRIRAYDHPKLPEDSVVIIDPPRSALHPKVVRRLVEQEPPEIIYVSCNPKLMAREMAAFLEKYDLVHLEAFDLFPHTPHVEAMARLKLKS